MTETFDAVLADVSEFDELIAGLRKSASSNRSVVGLLLYEFADRLQSAHATELAALRGDVEKLRETLQFIVDADWRHWQELASPYEFVRWAKARANHALQQPQVGGENGNG